MTKLRVLVPILIGVVVICAMGVKKIYTVNEGTPKVHFYTEMSVMKDFLAENTVIFGFTPHKEVRSGPVYDIIKTVRTAPNEQGFVENPGSWRNESFRATVTLVFERFRSLGHVWKLGWFIPSDFTVCTNNHIGGGIPTIFPVRQNLPYGLCVVGHLVVGLTIVDGLIPFLFPFNVIEKDVWSLGLGGEFKGMPQSGGLDRADYYQKTREDSKQPTGEAKIPPTDILGIVALVGILGSFYLQVWGGIRFMDGQRRSGGAIYCVGVVLLVVSLLGLLLGWGIVSN